ncbi:MAG: 4a-hydroxytetrahydrobiopterin dehydratase [Pseudomonadota bacterium]
MTDLADKRCEPCEGGVPPLTAEQAAELMRALSGHWQLVEDGQRIRGEFSFVGFNRAMAFANAVAWIAGIEGHHPEITLGYGYCRVDYWTHAIDGLSDNDFICAAKIDRLLSGEDG